MKGGKILQITHDSCGNKLMKQLRSETPEVPIFYPLWLVSRFFNLFLCPSPLTVIVHFLSLLFFPPWASTPTPIPPASPITSRADCIPPFSLFISPTVSAKAFQVLKLFFFPTASSFSVYLLVTVFACLASSRGRIVISFLCLNQSLLMDAFF